MTESYRYGQRVKLKDITIGSFFFYAMALYEKTGTTKDRSTYYLCHPISPGQYGNIVQENINTWLSLDEEVNPAQIEAH
jgi:hypothetical protein